MARHAASVAASVAVLLAGPLGLIGCGRPAPATPPRAPVAAAHGPCYAGPALKRGSSQGMVRLTGGRFLMGAAPARPEEGPPRPTTVRPFWISATEVTNDAFAAFVGATGYVTLAERPLDAAAYPTLTAEQRRPSSIVFAGETAAPVDLDNPASWWRVVQGADWRHPQGPGSSLAGKGALPVVQVAYDDALAYARWFGGDLPTEAEWEYAARGGLEGQPFVWGAQKTPNGKPAANVWQGPFPAVDTGEDGYPARLAPVGCFAPNGFGLFDMAGNVWEWTSDWYARNLGAGEGDDPRGPAEPPRSGASDVDGPRHVIKGGSFLCADNYCFRYRPAAREAGPTDTGSSHVGFRVIRR